VGDTKIKIGRLSVFWFFSLIILSGCLLGFLFYLALPHLHIGSWYLFAEPPRKAIKILSQRFPDVYVQSVDNNIYACSSTNQCIQVDEPQQEVESRSCGSPDSIAPIAPGKIIDSLTYRSCGPDGYADVHIIILEDGSIWKWVTGWSSFGMELEIPAYSLCGALLGAAVGFVVYKIKHRRIE